MAKKESEVIRTTSKEIPQNLSEHPFFGFNLDEQQKIFRDAIWDKEKLIVFCNSKAGTGKTVIATATAELLVKYGIYEGITYIAAPTQEQKQGYLPGDIERKSEPYFAPFYQALRKIGVNINTCMADDIINMKNGTGYISCQTHTFLRGGNIENQVVIVDEMQNYTLDELKKTISRIHDTSKLVGIGHTGQIDLMDIEQSGFQKYLNSAQDDNRIAICELTKNYRGWISTWADSVK